MAEAPSSPRSAALYYWGGSNSTVNGMMDDNDKEVGFYWEEVQPEQKQSTSADLQMNSPTRWHHGVRRQLKFTLSMDDDDDDTHWMFVRPHAQISLGGCFVSTDAPVIEEEKEGDCSFEVGVPESNELNDFDSIPIVDLSLPVQGANGYASQIAEACRSSGFFYITNHGVDQNLMQSVMEISRQFFSLPLKDKLIVGNREGSSGYRGYFGIGMEDLENKDGTRDLNKEEGDTKQVKGDQKEGFDCGLEVSGYHENPLSRKAYFDFFGANSWPDEGVCGSIVGFRETLTEYQKALLQLSDKLMIALAISLSSDNDAVPLDYFIKQSRNPMCTLRLLHYPPSPTLPAAQLHERLNSATGCGAHTDYGLFTILQQDDIGGLQIRNKSNTWIDARPLSGSFVINVGDMLSWWTEGEYASTVHRVISPVMLDEEEKNGENAPSHRYSIPFFFNPDHDARVKPIRDISGDESGKGKTAIEILKERYAGTFGSKQ